MRNTPQHSPADIRAAYIPMTRDIVATVPVVQRALGGAPASRAAARYDAFATIANTIAVNVAIELNERLEFCEVAPELLPARINLALHPYAQSIVALSLTMYFDAHE